MLYKGREEMCLELQRPPPPRGVLLLLLFLPRRAVELVSRTTIDSCDLSKGIKVERDSERVGIR